VHVPPEHDLDLGPIERVDVGDNALILTFAAGIELRFALTGEGWSNLHRFVLRGEPIQAGHDGELYARLAEIVGAVRHLDA
jgi:hypothetical protein